MNKNASLCSYLFDKILPDDTTLRRLRYFKFLLYIVIYMLAGNVSVTTQVVGTRWRHAFSPREFLKRFVDSRWTVFTTSEDRFALKRHRDIGWKGTTSELEVACKSSTDRSIQKLVNFRWTVGSSWFLRAPYNSLRFLQSILGVQCLDSVSFA